jgi:hypothetical protein
MVLGCVADPDPSDPYVFGPPGYGSISQRHGSRTGSGFSIVKQNFGLYSVVQNNFLAKAASAAAG